MRSWVRIQNFPPPAFAMEIARSSAERDPDNQRLMSMYGRSNSMIDPSSELSTKTLLPMRRMSSAPLQPAWTHCCLEPK